MEHNHQQVERMRTWVERASAHLGEEWETFTTTTVRDMEKSSLKKKATEPKGSSSKEEHHHQRQHHKDNHGKYPYYSPHRSVES